MASSPGPPVVTGPETLFYNFLSVSRDNPGLSNYQSVVLCLVTAELQSVNIVALLHASGVNKLSLQCPKQVTNGLVLFIKDLAFICKWFIDDTNFTKHSETL